MQSGGSSKKNLNFNVVNTDSNSHDSKNDVENGIKIIHETKEMPINDPPLALKISTERISKKKPRTAADNLKLEEDKQTASATNQTSTIPTERLSKNKKPRSAEDNFKIEEDKQPSTEENENSPSNQASEYNDLKRKKDILLKLVDSSKKILPIQGPLPLKNSTARLAEITKELLDPDSDISFYLNKNQELMVKGSKLEVENLTNILEDNH